MEALLWVVGVAGVCISRCRWTSCSRDRATVEGRGFAIWRRGEFELAHLSRNRVGNRRTEARVID